MFLQPHRETVFLMDLQLARKSGREFQPTCSRHKLAQGLVMRGQLLARNTTVTARPLVGTDRCPTDRYFDADSPQFACACLTFLEFPKICRNGLFPPVIHSSAQRRLKLFPYEKFRCNFP